MPIKSLQTLVSEAMQEIKTINADEAFNMVELFFAKHNRINLLIFDFCVFLS